MIIKRKIGYLFLLSAALLMIINVILPHHHHEDEVCFIVEHCDVDEGDAHGEKPDHDGVEHEHHKGDVDFCQLNDLYHAPQPYNLIAKIRLIFSEKEFSSDLFSDNLYQIEFTLSSVSSENRFIPDKHSLAQTSLTRALRAPPGC